MLQESVAFFDLTKIDLMAASLRILRICIFKSLRDHRTRCRYVISLWTEVRRWTTKENSSRSETDETDQWTEASTSTTSRTYRDLLANRLPPISPSSGELQHQNSDLQRDLANLKKELELTNQKLGSSMHSIKTFWSPELKKERALRKEESAKYSLINDQLKLLSNENQLCILVPYINRTS
ncbi:hypothetical protein NQ317_002333 [Molorchus minor]|uniref:Uncharacterized protein n=1 Tax=Molorchus minor TaxID=1323400 RepID=A0ABQ9IRU1_9CUCU|nr:hypothetical protein NQ317_002333 [Molorchus minor]